MLAANPWTLLSTVGAGDDLLDLNLLPWQCVASILCCTFWLFYFLLSSTVKRFLLLHVHVQRFRGTTWDWVPGSPYFSILQAMDSWVGPGNEAISCIMSFVLLVLCFILTMNLVNLTMVLVGINFNNFVNHQIKNSPIFWLTLTAGWFNTTYIHVHINEML